MACAPEFHRQWYQAGIVAEHSGEKSNGRNLRTVVAKTFLSGMASSMMRAIMQPFVLSLGAPMSTLGLLESLGGMRGVLTSPLQYYSGWLSDHLGRRPIMILGNVSGVLGIGFFVFGGCGWFSVFPPLICADA